MLHAAEATQNAQKFSSFFVKEVLCDLDDPPIVLLLAPEKLRESSLEAFGIFGNIFFCDAHTANTSIIPQEEQLLSALSTATDEVRCLVFRGPSELSLTFEEEAVKNLERIRSITQHAIVICVNNENEMKNTRARLKGTSSLFRLEIADDGTFLDDAAANAYDNFQKDDTFVVLRELIFTDTQWQQYALVSSAAALASQVFFGLSFTLLTGVLLLGNVCLQLAVSSWMTEDELLEAFHRDEHDEHDESDD